MPHKKRPSSITIELYQNSKKVQSKKVSESDNWKYTFTLPKYDSEGNEYKYTLKEAPVEGYQTIQTGNDFTNVYKPVENQIAVPIKIDPSNTVPANPTVIDPIPPKMSDPKTETKKLLPRTGDTYQSDLLLIFTGFIIFIGTFIFIRRNNRRTEK